jgi:hypothetical protein
MTNLLERAINCDDADRAARIIQNALGIESDDVEPDPKLDRQCFIVRDANGQALTSVCRQEKGALECYEWSRPRR